MTVVVKNIIKVTFFPPLLFLSFICAVWSKVIQMSALLDGPWIEEGRFCVV